MKKVTIKDVAKKAGVAPSSVSNALNPKSKKISSSTRKKILDIVSEMGYVPDSSAQKISMKNHRKIGFFIQTSDKKSASQMSEQFIHYMNKHAYEKNLDLINIILPYYEKEFLNEVEHRVKAYGITDIIMYGIEEYANAAGYFEKMGVNLIFIEIPVEQKDSNYISVNNYKMQKKVINRVLLNHNVQRILYISGDLGSYVGRERHKAVCDLNNESKLSIEIIESVFDYKYTYEILQEVDLTKYDYIACGSDDILLGAAKHLQEIRHYPVMSGFDNSFVLDYIDYVIYTVEQDIENITHLVIKMITEQKYETVLLDGKVIRIN